MMDDRSNGILMPSSKEKAKKMKRQFFHCGSHGIYSAGIDQVVQRVEKDFNSGKISAAEARMKIAQLQTVTRATLQAPLLPGRSPVRLS
jgi:hypothetical protein